MKIINFFAMALLAKGWAAVTPRQNASPNDISPQLGDEGIVVPLIPETTQLPLEDVDAFYRALGPRFVNAIALNATSNNVELDLSCLGKCAGTVLKLAPCIVTAIATKNPAALLTCGIGKQDICNCVNCLPDAVLDFIGGFCASDFDAPVSQENGNSEDFTEYSQLSTRLQGFRGDLLNSTRDVSSDVSNCYDGTFVGGTCGCCLGLYADLPGRNETFNCVGTCINGPVGMSN